MDAKLTLSFDAHIIAQAKRFTDDNNISLSRLTEFLLGKVTSTSYKSQDEMPVSDWVNMLDEGEVQYERTPPSSKKLKEEYHQKKKAK